MIIVDVDYRLAPEFPFPTQIHDSWAALKWVFSKSINLGIDSSRVSIGGLSAGGHLAAVLAILARDDLEMPPLKLQLLVVPVIDVRYIPVEGSCEKGVCPYESYFSCEYAPCLPLNRMRWFSNLWIGTEPGELRPSSLSLFPSLADKRT
jgi:acetyl esterase/lipase